MSIPDIAVKIIVPLIVAIIITISGVVINVYIMDNKLVNNGVTNMKQWDFISKINERSIRNEEKITCKGAKCGEKY